MEPESLKSEWLVKSQTSEQKAWPDILIKIILLLSLAVATVVVQTAYSFYKDIRAAYVDACKNNISEPRAQACIKAQRVVDKNPWRVLRKNIEGQIIVFTLKSKADTFSITVSAEDNRYNAIKTNQLITFSKIDNESSEYQFHITPR